MVAIAGVMFVGPRSLAGAPQAEANGPEDKPAGAGDSAVRLVEVGIDGSYKLGFWTTVRVVLNEAANESGEPCVVALDGDGNEAVFRLREGVAPSNYKLTSGETYWEGLAKFGRLRGPVFIRWLNESGNVVQEEPVSPQVTANGIGSTAEIVVVLGGLEGAESALGRAKSAAGELRLVQLDGPDELPSRWIAWDAVDTLVVTYSESDWVSGIAPAQADAIVQWVEQGGQVVISVGSNAAEVLTGNELANRLVPGRFVKVVDHPNSAGFETYALSNEQLLEVRGDSIEICQLSDVTGSIEAFEGRSERDLPIVVRSPRGLGRVVFVAFDLNQPRFVNWAGRNRFLGKIFGRQGGSNDGTGGEGRGGRVSHIGYTDLSGQLRSALDRFEGVQLVSFTLVAVLVVLFIICIGPADFFFLRKVVKRMEFTWITFSLIVILFTAAALVTANLTKGDSVRVNQVEIVDIDFATSTVRGSAWSTIYSPQSDRYQIEYESAAGESPIEVTDSLVSWQGLPGTGLGGMDSTLTPSVAGQSYQIELSDADQMITTKMKNVPIQVASTRTIIDRWAGRIEPGDYSSLEVDLRSDSLIGQLTNPLDVELTRAVIIYGQWAYMVDRDIAPGEMIDIERDTTERTLDGYLTRRQVNEGRDETTPWDPTDVDIHRIVEMLMFHEAAGGEAYTRLTQRLHAPVDLSGHLTPDRAVFFGLSPSRNMTMKIDGQAADDCYGESHTYYRFVMPVVNPYLRN